MASTCWFARFGNVVDEDGRVVATEPCLEEGQYRCAQPTNALDEHSRWCLIHRHKTDIRVPREAQR